MNCSDVKAANRGGFTINLSADNLAQVDQLLDDVVAPIVTLLPIDAKPITRTPNGHKVIACPAETSPSSSLSTTCANCGWCARADRGFIVGFRAHGQSKQKVVLIATAYIATKSASWLGLSRRSGSRQHG